jgi:hypothetical protein
VNSRLAVLLLLALAASGCAGPAADAETGRFVGPAPPPEQALALPNRPGSIKFAAIGDAGRGDRAQYDVAAQMVAFREVSTMTSS